MHRGLPGLVQIRHRAQNVRAKRAKPSPFTQPTLVLLGIFQCCEGRGMLPHIIRVRTSLLCTEKTINLDNNFKRDM